MYHKGWAGDDGGQASDADLSQHLPHHVLQVDADLIQHLPHLVLQVDATGTHYKFSL